MKTEGERSRLPCPDGHERDEIGALVEVINRQLQSIDVNMRQKLRAEERLRKYLEELESIVESRTNELQETNAQLRRSNQDLECSREEALDMARARSAFLANMSHEIRTPINGLLGMIGLTLDSPLNNEQKQQLSIAYDSGKVLVALLNDILDLSKFEAGKLQLERIPFDLGALLEETASLLSQNAGKQDIELTCRVDPRLPGMLLGDPTRIRQIISNLLSNALKFTEQGHVALTLNLEHSGSSEQRVRISVSDTGIGIADESLEAIFSPFTQADAHISRRFGGTGLGLALCRSLTDAMGGDLTVQSTLGHGSTFSVSIPLATHTQQPGFPKPTPRTVTIWNQSGNLQGAVLEELLTSWGMTCMLIDYQPAANKALKLGIRQQVASPPSRRRLAQAIDELFGLFKDTQAPSKTEVSAAGQRLLLVEDNMVNQMVAKGMLSRLGYEVDLAEHGEIALSMLEKAPYSLVLMDCNMPVMDGYEASRRIRADPRWKDLPIIALTANALHEDRQRCQDAGMSDYLAKPFKREDLQAILQRWLSSQRTD